ncbi:MAG: MCP four helix bundle domain-containing protein, partial [Bryobacteraceae bacterium]|nr:MCP four helix bundle domain-containing protein [Bryobacteraceae bacterium]
MACSALILITMLSCLTGWESIRGLRSSTTDIAERSVPELMHLGEAQVALYTFRGEVWKHIGSRKAEEMRAIEAKMEGAQGELERSFAAYQKGSKEAEAEVVSLRSAWQSYLLKWLELRDLSRAAKNEEAYDRAGRELHPLFVELSGQIERAMSMVEKRTSETSAGALAAGERATQWMVGMGVIALVLGVGVGVWLTRGMKAAVSALATELAETADHVAAASNHISESAQTLASGATEHSASIEETSATAEEISATARRNAETASTAAEVMSSLAGNFRRTDEKLEQMVAAMGEISSSSARIGNIIKVIDEIAFQTNILALNAAVEAARAGQAGAGFAVVADEVRSLAQRSAQAARETATLIEESINRSRDGAAQVDEV